MFAKLRWRAVRATWQGGGRAAVVEILATILLLAIGVFGGAATFVGLRAASPGPNMSAGLIIAASLLVAATTGFATVVGVNNSLDIRVIATEPLTGFQRAIGQLAMAAVGPTGIAMTLVGLGTVLGVTRSPSSVPLVLLSVITLLVFNLLLARVVINLLGTLANRWPRLGQLVSGFAGLTIMVGYQVAANVFPDLSASEFRSVAGALKWFPGGSVGRSLGGASLGGVGSGADWAFLVWTAIWIPPLIWLFVFSTERLIVAAAGGRQRAVRDRSDWRRWFGSGPVGALATRTAITTARSPRRLIELIMGSALAGASVVVPPVLAHTAGEAQRSLADPIVGIATVTGFGACFTAIMAMSNMFGADGPAFTHELLAGVSMRDMVRAKRRAAVAVGVPVAVIGTIAVAVVTGAWSTFPASFGVAFAGVFGGSAVALMQSSWAPFAVPDDMNPFAFNAGPSGIVPVLMWIGSVFALVVLMAPVLIGLGLAAFSGALWLTTLIGLAAVPWAYGISRVAEGLSVNHLSGNEPRLIDQVTKT